VNNQSSRNRAAGADAAKSRDQPQEEVKHLEEEVEAIRDNLGRLVSELDHRRHDAFDLRLQLRRHARPLAIGLAGVLVLAAVGGIFAYRARQRRRSVSARLASARRLFARAIDDPRQRERPRVSRKILAAGGAASASVLGRYLTRRLLARSPAGARAAQ
jgi:hypothetical protein